MVSGERTVRTDADDMTLFDSVGFALEDYSMLRCVWNHARELGLGRESSLIFEPAHPKDLFAELSSTTANRRIA